MFGRTFAAGRFVRATLAATFALTAFCAVAYAGTTAHDHNVTVSKVEKQVTLNAGEQRTVTLTCPGGGLISDGAARVDSVDQGTGTLASVEINEARTIDDHTYEFTLVNHATGHAQTKVFGTCLPARTTTVQGHSHALLIKTVVYQEVNWATGRQTATLHCPSGTVPIAPSFNYSYGAGRQYLSQKVGSTGWKFGFDNDGPATVGLTVSCLRVKVGKALHHQHKLLFNHRVKTVTVPAHSTGSYQLSCGDLEKGIVATYDLPDGVVQYGHDPQPKTRVFRLSNNTGSSLTATIDLFCVNDRTGGKTH